MFAFDQESQMSQSGKIVLKLTCNSVTKRVRELPENFEALKSQVKAQMCKSKNIKDSGFLLKDQFQITYTDDTGDVIHVSDDEDLLGAYDAAETCMNRQLRLQIDPREDLGYPSLDTIPESKTVQNPKIQEEKTEPSTLKEFKEEEPDQIPMINSTIVKEAIHEAMGGGQNEEELSSSSSDDEDKNGQKHKRGGKRCKGKKADKSIGGLPRKCFKRLIKKELDKQCQQIFKDMMTCSEICPPEDVQMQEGEPVVHQHVECDGCGVAPIVGVRYKCTVCKNFDFCSVCEERKPHDHAFLKIKDLGQAPKAMFTVIDENMKNAQPDVEQEATQNPTYFRNSMPFGGFRGGCRGGRGRFGGPGGHHGHGPHGPFGHHGPHHHGPHGHHGHHGPHGHHHGHHGHHGRWSHGHEQPDFSNIGNAIGGFFQNMMGNMGYNQKCGGKGQWKVNKALIVSLPQSTLIGKPGQMIFANIEMKNGMHWPWKEGASLISDFAPDVQELIDEVAIPIDFKVEPQAAFKMVIPIQIKESAQLTCNTGALEHVAKFTFVGRQGKPFGEPIEVKFKVEKEIDEVQFYQNAMQLFESQGENELPFNDIVQVLKEANNDMAMAREMIKTRSQNSQVHEENKMEI